MLYILAIEPPLAHAKYYLGYCQDGRLKARIQEHQSGYGAKLTRAAIESGRNLTLVATLARGTRQTERQLKRRKSTPRLVESIKSNPKEWSLK
jgi:predicted GIY-YIG superfamily endonuclease